MCCSYAIVTLEILYTKDSETQKTLYIIYIYTFVVSLSLSLFLSLSLYIYIYVPHDCELLKCGGFALASSPPFVSAYLSRVVAMAPCPHGHRALEVKDIAVGMQVVYVSRDANTLINTHITKAGVFEGSSGPCVATQHKHTALLNRLFVPQRQSESSAPDEGAAVGATQTAATAPAGEYDSSSSSSCSSSDTLPLGT